MNHSSLFTSHALLLAAALVGTACGTNTTPNTPNVHDNGADAASFAGANEAGAANPIRVASAAPDAEVARGSSDAGADDAGSFDAGFDDGGPIGDPTGVTAIPVSTFLGSLGVCSHIGQKVDAPIASAAAMEYAGIRNFRDHGTAEDVPGWNDMFDKTGVRMLLIANRMLSIPDTVAMAKQLNAKGALLAVEGPNEPNNWPITYMGQTSSNMTFKPVALYQRDLYAAIKGTPELAKTPVFHSSVAGGAQPDNVGLQFLTIPNGSKLTMPDGTKYADYANVHNYVAGHKHTLTDNVAWNATDPTLNGDWAGLYVEYGVTWYKGFKGYSNEDLVKLPRVSTETGWVTLGKDPITQEQQGRLFLDLYLSSFTRGYSYTFIYMLRDDAGQGYWGLFDEEYKPKKSGIYIHNFTSILADSRTRAPGKLDFRIETTSPTVHSALFQKSDGTFLLPVWGEKFSGGTDTVELKLGVSRKTVDIYDPITGTKPVMTMTNVSAITLSISDHPQIVAIPGLASAP